MKKIVFAFAAVVAIVASATAFANSHNVGHNVHNHQTLATHVTMQGKRCTGTVGCNCPGFSPITSGDVWQQAYCRHCGHKRSCHR